jgi:nicotinamide-nucleotide amidase
MQGQELPAEIITIGNEVLSGHTVNTNAAKIARRLGELGIAVNWTTTVGDVAEHMREAFQAAWNRAQVIVTTGGLGPTHDDITRSVFCEVFSRTLVRDEMVLQNIKELFTRRGRTLTERNIDQAMVPTHTEVMMNRWGTAPGIYLNEAEHHWFMLPGVPREMEGLLEHEVVPRLLRVVGERAIVRRELHVVGVPESHLMDRIDGIPGLEQVASLPDSTKGEVTLRITVAGNERAAAEAEVARLEGALRERVGEAIYGLDDETLEGVVGRLLTERGMTISLAESCTGGLVATRLTDVSGSSNYFPLAVVAYSNAAKEMLLGVPHDLIVEHGAVSEPVAKAMAEGVRRIGKTNIGVGVTGIAGPTGGTAEKPVGLTYIALSYEGGTKGEKFLFGGDRQMNRWRAATAVLDMVRRHFLGKAQ